MSQSLHTPAPSSAALRQDALVQGAGTQEASLLQRIATVVIAVPGGMLGAVMLWELLG